MKISSFMLGGICGIAAVVYMARKRPGVMAWMGGRLMNTALNKKFGKPSTQLQQQQPQANQPIPTTAQSATGTKSQSWQTLSQMLESDPKARQEAADILARATH